MMTNSIVLQAFLSLGFLASTACSLDGGTARIKTFNNWTALEVITQGDSRGNSGWILPGSLDGCGALLKHNNNTIRIHVNHETMDAKISEINIDRPRLMTAIQNVISTGTTGGAWFVRNARLAYKRTKLQEGTDSKFCRFCSSQTYAPHTFGPNRGFVDHLYITGEECFNSKGRLVVLHTGSRTLHQLSGLTGHSNERGSGNGGMPFDSWENAALIDTGDTSHVALLLSPDGGSQQMKLYIGLKGKTRNGRDANTFLSRNGLAYGSWYYLNGKLPSQVGQAHSNGFFSKTISDDVLQAVKLEDVDTSPSDPTRVVIGVQKSGVFNFHFSLHFDDDDGAFNAALSSFTLTKTAASLSGDERLNSPDNMDWTNPTKHGSLDYPDGMIFVNEDNASGEIWSMKPDGSHKIRIGRTNTGAEGTGLFDLSELVDYVPGSIIVTSSQGHPSSMTILINPHATPLH